MNVSGIFWTITLVFVAAFGYVAMATQIQQDNLDDLLDEVLALAQTNGGITQSVMPQIYKMANDKGFSPTYLEIYDKPADPITGTEATLQNESELVTNLDSESGITYNVPVKPYCLKTTMYVELRYPAFSLWNKVSQWVGTSGQTPGADMKVSSRTGQSQNPLTEYGSCNKLGVSL